MSGVSVSAELSPDNVRLTGLTVGLFFGREAAVKTLGSRQQRSCSMRKLEIFRQGWPQDERAVRIRELCPRGYMNHYVDPQAELLRATDVSLRRDNCIHSFAMGLIRADRSVIMHEQFTGRAENHYDFHRSFHPPFSVYLLCGAAWAFGSWERLVSQLQLNVRWDRRLAVLEHTANHYWECWQEYGETFRAMPPTRIILP